MSAPKGGPKLGQLAVQYLAERERRQELSTASARTIHFTLGTFVRSAGYDRHPARVTRAHVERWIDDRQPLSAATMRQQLSILRTFCKWLVEHGYTRRDPTHEIRSPRQPRLLPRALKADEVDALFEAAPDIRAALIVSLMVQEGLRCCEVENLQVGDLDTRERVILVVGKGGHQRLLPVSEETWSYLGRYLAEYPAASGPLIRSLSQPTRGITGKHVSWVVAQVFRAAKVGESAHALRHTMATDVLRSGAHVRDVQAALGHQSLATTQRYMPYVVGDLREAMGGRKYPGSVERPRRHRGGDRVSRLSRFGAGGRQPFTVGSRTGPGQPGQPGPPFSTLVKDERA